MRGAIPPLPQYVFMAWCLVKHRNNFAFYTVKGLEKVMAELLSLHLVSTDVETVDFVY
jgi:hypothetical protein